MDIWTERPLNALISLMFTHRFYGRNSTLIFCFINGSTNSDRQRDECAEHERKRMFLNSLFKIVSPHLMITFLFLLAHIKIQLKTSKMLFSQVNFNRVSSVIAVICEWVILLELQYKWTFLVNPRHFQAYVFRSRMRPHVAEGLSKRSVHSPEPERDLSIT